MDCDTTTKGNSMRIDVPGSQIANAGSKRIVVIAQTLTRPFPLIAWLSLTFWRSVWIPRSSKLRWKLSLVKPVVCWAFELFTAEGFPPCLDH